MIVAHAKDFNAQRIVARFPDGTPLDIELDTALAEEEEFPALSLISI